MELSLSLFLCLVLGVFFICTMKRMAIYKPDETISQEHKVLRITSIIFLLLGVLFFVLGMFVFPSIDLKLVATNINFAFSSLALATYCRYYKKSNRKWWGKLFRFFFGLFLWALFISATNVSNFTELEVVIIVLFLLMCCYVFICSGISNRERKKTKEQQVAIKSENEQKIETNSTVNNENPTRFMPPNTVEESKKTEEKQEVSIEQRDCITTVSPKNELNVEQKIEPIENKKFPKYCRHCGRKIEDINAVYCKYCGGKL